jgi:hypothetical protein
VRFLYLRIVMQKHNLIGEKQTWLGKVCWWFVINLGLFWIV